MIFFVANDGTVIASEPSSVYQGAADTNNIYLVAPFAEGLQASVAFKLPNGVYTTRYPMSEPQFLPGIVDKLSGQTYKCWQYSMPNGITQYYGTVTAQFFFYSEESGVITPTSSVSFVVGKGVPSIKPTAPSDDVFDAIMSNLSQLSKQLNNGEFAARAIYQWNSTYTYGAGEVTYSPDAGEFGAFVKSIVANNLNHPPFNAQGEIDTRYWEVVVSFDHIAEDYFTELKNLAADAAGSEESAGASAAAAQQALAEAKQQATNAAESAQSAAEAQAEAAERATAAADSAAMAATSEQEAASSAQAAESAKNAAAGSATEAQNWADIAKSWAEYGIKINTDYSAVADLPNPGDSHFIYLIPNGSTGDNSYDEYIWSDNKNAYEKIGTTEIDLTDYATKAALAEEAKAREEGDEALHTEIEEAKGTATPLMDGVASVGDSAKYARENHRHPTDTSRASTAVATQSANGLMSSDDKKKLDGIATGAQVNAVTGVKGNAETTYRTGNVNLTPANIGAAAATALTDGSVTKVGTTTKGSATIPVYLNAGTPTACTRTIPLITFNGSTNTSPSFYAPTSSGTSGYILKSSGSTTAPAWSAYGTATELLSLSPISTGAKTVPSIANYNNIVLEFTNSDSGSTTAFCIPRAVLQLHNTLGKSLTLYNGTAYITFYSTSNTTIFIFSSSKASSLYVYGVT